MRQPTSRGRKMLLRSIEWWDMALSLCLCQGRTYTSWPNDLVCGSERKEKRTKHWKSGLLTSSEGILRKFSQKNKQTNIQPVSKKEQEPGTGGWEKDHHWKFKVSFHYVVRASEERKTVSVRSGKCCQITWLQGHMTAKGLNKKEAF